MQIEGVSPMRHRALHQPVIALVTLLAAATPAAAGVNAFARQEPENPNHVILSTSSINTGDFAQATINSTIGQAFASASAGPGRLSGQSGVILQTGDEFASGKFTAFAHGRSFQPLVVGDKICISLSCNSVLQLGINSYLIGFRVRASGGVSAFSLDNRFDNALAEINYGWSLQAASAGGSRSRNQNGFATGSIDSQNGQILVRPGDNIELMLAMSVFSQANLSSFRNSGFLSGSATALADFSHTLEWDGITSFTAFDINGDVVQLAPGARSTLLDDGGRDFWNSAASFDAGPGGVPEPASWAMLIMGFGLTGAVMRRRTHRAVAA
jgi:hypothetical protein